jgi:hypothetical protein
MSIKRKAISRAGSLAAAVAVVLGALVPLLTPLVDAAAQVQSRSIQMSDATPGHANTEYTLKFTPQTTGAESAIIDFCSNSSIIGGACTAPVGLDVRTSLALTAQPTGWATDTSASVVTTGSRTNAIALKDSAPGTNNLSTTQVTFTFTGITNPSGAAGTFWARIYTYSNATYGTYNNPDTTVSGGPGAYLDYGGFALSTTTLINITATVMETLTFCTAKTTPADSCATTDAPNLILGQGTPAVLSTTTPSTDTAYFQISTNALHGAIVNMKSHNLSSPGCDGLSRDSGVTCDIPGTASTTNGATPNDFTADNLAEFGLNVGPGVASATGTGTVSPSSPYATTGNYGMATGVTGTYGSTIATTGGAACSNMNTPLTFAAQASVTTPAGVYSVDESLIATGTF